MGAESARAVLRQDAGGLVSFGRLFVSNPDLPRRLRDGLPLTDPDPATFYGGDAHGYVDYPAYPG
ncbi:hypothetical protein [Streptomyces sp. NPDC001410]|uniref:hypothetical protein n=1 Tax=Streptomyces sp. NPDC001410 TaxID=3364574 RepID=UPI0036BF803F